MTPKFVQDKPMSKTASFHIWLGLLACTTMFILAGCGVITSTIAPTPPSAAPTLPYIHYTPSATSNIYLQFDYPSSWVFSEETIEDTYIRVIGLGDPRLLTVPTRAPNESHGTPSNFGRVTILIQPESSNQTLDSLVEAYKQGHSDVNWIRALDDYQITIDGYNTLVLEYQIEPFDNNGYTSSMFERNIFFAVKDQIYKIAFVVAEKERGGEFEKGFEYFFNSLKIVP